MEYIYRYTRHAEPLMWLLWIIALVLAYIHNFMPQTNVRLFFVYWLLGVFILEVIFAHTMPLEYDFEAHSSEKINTIIYVALFICPRLASVGAGVLSMGIFSKSIGVQSKISQDPIFTGFLTLMIAEIFIYIVSFQSEIVRQNYLFRFRYPIILLFFGVSLFFQKI